MKFPNDTRSKLIDAVSSSRNTGNDSILNVCTQANNDFVRIEEFQDDINPLQVKLSSTKSPGRMHIQHSGQGYVGKAEYTSLKQ